MANELIYIRANPRITAQSRPATISTVAMILLLARWRTRDQKPVRRPGLVPRVIAIFTPTQASGCRNAGAGTIEAIRGTIPSVSNYVSASNRFVLDSSREGQIVPTVRRRAIAHLNLATEKERAGRVGGRASLRAKGRQSSSISNEVSKGVPAYGADGPIFVTMARGGGVA